MSRYGNVDLCDAIVAGIWAVFVFVAIFFSSNPFIIAAGIFFGILFAALAAVSFVIFLRDGAFDKNLELADIVRKCRYHPDKDIQDAVREAAFGAKYWTFKTIWKKFCDSHDFGRVFTAIYR